MPESSLDIDLKCADKTEVQKSNLNSMIERLGFIDGNVFTVYAILNTDLDLFQHSTRKRGPGGLTPQHRSNHKITIRVD
jgi:hypothetical protein